MAGGVSEEHADIFVDQAEKALEDPSQLEETAEALKESPEQLLEKFRGEISVGGALGMLKFVLMERFLGLWDMISDVLMADLIGNCRLLQDSQCSFEPNDDAPEYTPTDERRAVRERFFWVSVFFLFFNATVLWVAICQHFLHPACADFGRVTFEPLRSKVEKYE